MRNPVLYYVIIGLGVIALAVGLYYLPDFVHHSLRASVGIAAGIILLLVGIIGIFVVRPRSPKR